MIKVNVSKKDGNTIGAWVFDSDTKQGVFLTMNAVKKVTEFLDKIPENPSEHEEEFDGIICCWTNTKQLVLADGVREDEGNVSRSIEFVIIERGELLNFQCDIEKVQ